jgi:sugar phosphate isomerase/epimerase
MKLLGHTLGTPHLSVEEALRLFADIGLDGAEIIWQDGYRSGIPESDDASARRVRQVATDLGLEIACLTPYLAEINNIDTTVRRKDVERFRHCLDVAAELGSGLVRVYAGTYHPERDVGVRNQKWELLVESLADLAATAAARHVVLCVENHFGTMTVSARETRQLVEQVRSDHVAILYDQANLTFTHAEDYPEAIALQQPWIRHVHAKDLVFTAPDRPFTSRAVHTVQGAERSVRSRVVGEGILDWFAIFDQLRRTGYDGPVSIEYEARWHPQDLPPPEIGFRRSAQAIREMLDAAPRTPAIE